MAESPILEARDLRVDYGALTAVHGLSLRLEAGQIMGLVGPNGAGKTSTIRVLATLLDPTHGDVRVCGHDIFEAPAAARACIGYMPDLAPVNPDLRVGEFLEVYDRAYGMPDRDRAFRLDRALRAVGLEASRKGRARELSRGMTQRLVLAKTLLHEPDFLLLDEPASGMDPIARRDLRDILKAQSAEGRAVLVSSHILSELADMCTHVAIMHKGHLRACGSVEEISRSFRQAAARPVRVRLAGEAAPLARWLESQPAVAALAHEGERLRFDFTGEEADAAALLRAIVQAGFLVCGFEVQRPSLEDILAELHAEPGEAKA
ncbi:MAG: ATP-binding cassette domain-containing protein [Opitutales bacterium]